MKFNKTIIFALIIISVSLIFCSCSRNTNRAVDRAVRMGENAIDRGIGDIGNGIDNASDVVTNRGTYGANNGYNGFSGTGMGMAGTGITGSTGSGMAASGNATELMPTIRDGSRDNMGQINTTNGKSDGGNGDMYDDFDMHRNSIRRDTFNSNIVKKK